MGRKTNGCVPFFQQKAKATESEEIEARKKEENKKKVFPVKLFQYFYVDASSRKRNKVQRKFSLVWHKKEEEKKSFIDKGEEHTAQQQHTREKKRMKNCE